MPGGVGAEISVGTASPVEGFVCGVDLSRGSLWWSALGGRESGWCDEDGRWVIK